MIWFAIILAIIVGVIAGIITRSYRRAVIVFLGTLTFGVLLSLVIVYSGLMGG
ncbi:MAG: hypothetical protein KAT29_02600 [Anaerolineales bacterium]|nr:hypothetical protein [Anaerolineales bacterium]